MRLQPSAERVSWCRDQVCQMLRGWERRGDGGCRTGQGGAYGYCDRVAGRKTQLASIQECGRQEKVTNRDHLSKQEFIQMSMGLFLEN